jgi:hypothetical protein
MWFRYRSLIGHSVRNDEANFPAHICLKGLWRRTRLCAKKLYNDALVSKRPAAFAIDNMHGDLLRQTASYSGRYKQYQYFHEPHCKRIASEFHDYCCEQTVTPKTHSRGTGAALLPKWKIPKKTVLFVTEKRPTSIGTGWSEPVCGRQLRPPKCSAFHGALFRQLSLPVQIGRPAMNCVITSAALSGSLCKRWGAAITARIVSGFSSRISSKEDLVTK